MMDSWSASGAGMRMHSREVSGCGGYPASPVLGSVAPEASGARELREAWGSPEAHEACDESSPGRWDAVVPASVKERAAWMGNVEDQDLLAVASTLDTERSTDGIEAAKLPPFPEMDVCPVDLDMTVMAYARWLSEQQQASSQRHAELDGVRESLEHHSAELTDFKRHSARLSSQLQRQVSELRTQLEALQQQLLQQLQRHQADEQRASQASASELRELREELRRSAAEHQAGRRAMLEQLGLLQEDVSGWNSKLSLSTDTMERLKHVVTSGEEKILLKSCEVDKTIGMFHSWVTSVREELQECKEDWKRGNDLLGQAIQTVSQDVSDVQKHLTTVTNKVQSDHYRLDDACRHDRDRLRRAEAQLSGLQQSLLNANNELILLKRLDPQLPTFDMLSRASASGGDCQQFGVQRTMSIASDVSAQFRDLVREGSGASPKSSCIPAAAPRVPVPVQSISATGVSFSHSGPLATTAGPSAPGHTRVSLPSTSS